MPKDTQASVLVDLTRATTPLSAAQARTALRNANVVSAESLAALAAQARVLAANATVMEVAAGTAARTAGLSPTVLGEIVGLKDRQVHERYARHKVRTKTPSRAIPALVDYDPATGQPRPLVLELHLLTGALSLTPSDEPSHGWVDDRYHWPVPLMTGPAADTLLQIVEPLALRVLAGTDIIDGRKVPDTDADQALDQIQQVCAAAEHTYPVLRVVSAAEHYAGQDPMTVATGLGLSPGATTDQVAAAAERAQANAHAQLRLLQGAHEYLSAAVASGPSSAPPPQTRGLPVGLSHELAPHLQAVVRALRPVIDEFPHPLGSGRAYRTCEALMDAIDAHDSHAMAQAVEHLVALSPADQFDLAAVPGLRPAWNALMQAAQQPAQKP